MRSVSGVWLPDSESHMQGFLLNKASFVGGIGTYQLEKINRALSLLDEKRTTVALDIGAHVGTWARLLAMRFDRVVCFEPHPLHLECLRRNISDWGLKNVEVHEVALGSEAGEAFIESSDGNTGNSWVSDKGAPCRVVTLDSFGFDDVGLIKADCEGYEYFALLGGKETILRFRPLIVVEQKGSFRHGIGDFEACKLIESWGAMMLTELVGDYYYAWPND